MMKITKQGHPPTPNDVFEGRCVTCYSEVQAERNELGPLAGAFDYRALCPVCEKAGATVWIRAWTRLMEVSDD